MKSSMRKIAAGLLGGMMIAAGAAVIPASAGQIFTTPATVAKVGDKTPVIDGVYSPDEGWGDPITTVTYDMTQQEGAYLSLCDTSHPELLQDKDLIPSKVDVYMRWDEKALYYCAVVVQEKRYNDVVSEGDIWKMDSIIFNITSKDDDDDKNRIGLGVTNDGTILANVYATEGGTYGCDNLADWKVTRNEETKTTTYEVPFLWEEIMENEKVPTGTLKFRDLLMPTSEAGQENPVDFNLSGIAENGKYKYWDLTFADSASGGASAASAAPGNWVSSSFTSSFDDPDWHASAEDIEFEDSYVADATNCLMNDGSYYVFLKNFGKGDYSVEFEAKEDGLYEIGICLMAWQKSVPRATNVKVDDSDWVRLEFDYNDEDKQLEQFITGLTINLTKGTHKLTLGLPEGHDDTTLKTLYFDYFFYRFLGESAEIPADAAPASAAPASPEGYPASGESGNFMMGTVIGNETGWDGTAASGAASAFDGNPATFFDPLGVGDGYCGMQFDEPYILEKVAILSRATFLDRFAGASIEGSNDGEEWETLWESDDVAPSETEYNIVTDFENNYGYTMFRYINWINHGDVAEVEFYGKPGKVDPPAKEEEPAPAEEPKEETPTVEEVVENAAENVTEAVENVADAAGEAVNNAAEAVSNTVENAKSGCGSFIGGGLIVLVSVLGSAWIAKRR